MPPSSEGDGGISQQSPGAFLFSTIYFILLAFFAYYYIVVRPSQIEEDDKKKFTESLKKGDEVCTTGGIVGRFVQKKDSIIIIEIAPKVEIRVLSSEVMKKPVENSPKESDTKKIEDNKKKQ